MQWNETDLDYMLRRIQQDGIFFWHDQAQGYEYDKADRIRCVVYEGGTKVDLSYDKGGLLVQEILREPREATPKYTRFTYDMRAC